MRKIWWRPLNITDTGIFKNNNCFLILENNALNFIYTFFIKSIANKTVCTYIFLKIGSGSLNKGVH